MIKFEKGRVWKIRNLTQKQNWKVKHYVTLSGKVNKTMKIFTARGKIKQMEKIQETIKNKYQARSKSQQINGIDKILKISRGRANN